MGWKASCILVDERKPGHLVTTSPRHDPERARKVAGVVESGRHRSRGMTTFDAGIHPDSLVVGAYDGMTIIGHPDIAKACLEPAADPITSRILTAFPQAAVLRVGLDGVANLWSYAYFERGKLRRAHGGTADDGVLLDAGEPLTEEKAHFERSIVRDGERIFFSEIDGRAEEFDASAFGETLVFEVMARFLGCRPDETKDDFDPLELPMERFERAESRRWWWPFAGS